MAPLGFAFAIKFILPVVFDRRSFEYFQYVTCSHLFPLTYRQSQPYHPTVQMYRPVRRWEVTAAMMATNTGTC